MKMTKTQLLNALVSSEKQINQLESDLLMTAIVKLMTDMVAAIKNELKGDLHLEQVVRVVVPALVFIYCSGIEAKKFIEKISKHFIYESYVNGVSMQAIHTSGN